MGRLFPLCAYTMHCTFIPGVTVIPSFAVLHTEKLARLFIVQHSKGSAGGQGYANLAVLCGDFQTFFFFFLLSVGPLKSW